MIVFDPAKFQPRRFLHLYLKPHSTLWTPHLEPATSRPQDAARHSGPWSCPKSAALWYAAHGIPIFPVHSVRNGQCSRPKGAACEDMGKDPRDRPRV